MVKHNAARSLQIRCTGGGRYVIRTENQPADVDTMRIEIVAALGADGDDPAEIVEVHYVGDTALDELFNSQPTPPVSLGWEALILPGSKRRLFRLPQSTQITFGIRDAEPEHLRNVHRWSAQDYDDPTVDHDESLLIRLEGQVIGWIPVWRLTSHTSLVRHTRIDQNVFADDIKRHTLLALGTYARAVEHQLEQGRAVMTWLPDDNNEVNHFKVQVGGGVQATHWLSVRVRRDLQ